MSTVQSPLRIVDLGPELSDEDREVLIEEERVAMEKAHADYQESNCLSDLGRADAHRRRRDDLVRGRSPQYVRKLENERGLR